jgi:3-phosphoshikimate 1-carboxyvinyltransferase
MERMGCALTRPTADTIRCTGKLQAGEYVIDGGVSSQFITGLLFATALMDGRSSITITGTLESKPYVDMTEQALKLFYAPIFHTPGYINVEGDWSNGAFFLAAQWLGSDLWILGLDQASLQGDRAVLDILKAMENGMPTVSAKDIPDLVPILSVAAAAKHGAVFTDIRRLRLKESDRVASTIAMIENLGGKAEADENALTIHGTGLMGGTVDAVNDHRIAMSAAIAATVCKEDVTILGAECVKKSYPHFWKEYARLGGNYEQYPR